MFLSPLLSPLSAIVLASYSLNKIVSLTLKATTSTCPPFAFTCFLFLFIVQCKGEVNWAEILQLMNPPPSVPLPCLFTPLHTYAHIHLAERAFSHKNIACLIVNERTINPHYVVSLSHRSSYSYIITRCRTCAGLFV